MKLRNKKTGEIINSEDLFSKSFSYFDVKIDDCEEFYSDMELLFGSAE